MLTQVLSELDETIEQAITEGVFPGAALWVGWRGETVKCAAYGRTAAAPDPSTPVTTRTIYDIASLTKIVATTSAVMQLVERGLLHLDDTIGSFFPQQFAAGNNEQKATVTLWHVLTHTSGLPPFIELAGRKLSKNELIAIICQQDLRFAPGTAHLYSDLGFILLGEIIALVSGLPLDEYTRQHLYTPLEISDTGFNLPAELHARIAPTEREEGRGLIHGKVHDERAWAVGGVAGHAGLFSTVEDLGRFCTMLLNGGEYEGKRLFAAETLSAFTAPQNVNFELPFGLGWMIEMPYFMGSLVREGAFGHTGFTGTSLLVVPRRRLAAVLLTNRVYPNRNGPPINPCRQRLAEALARLR